MQRVRDQIEVPSFHFSSLKEDGKWNGITVAVLDTGIGRHPDLTGKLLCFRDFVGKRNLMYDDNGHGTHVCGIICGNGSLSEGRYMGVAPCARLVVGKVLDAHGEGSAECMLEGLRWILEVYKKYRIRILNISVGIGDLRQAQKAVALNRQLEKVWNSGLTVICAAGNKGPENGSISSVGDSHCVITVGCHDGDYFTDNPKRCALYSGRGEALSRFRKPDIVAPGTDIVSCNAFYRRMHGKIWNAYVTKSGTSMATPIVTGAAALALERNPELTNEELKQKLTMTATDLGEPWNQQGWGMVNVKRLLK